MELGINKKNKIKSNIFLMVTYDRNSMTILLKKS